MRAGERSRSQTISSSIVVVCWRPSPQAASPTVKVAAGCVGKRQHGEGQFADELAVDMHPNQAGGLAPADGEMVHWPGSQAIGVSAICQFLLRVIVDQEEEAAARVAVAVEREPAVRPAHLEEDVVPLLVRGVPVLGPDPESTVPSSRRRWSAAG